MNVLDRVAYWREAGVILNVLGRGCFSQGVLTRVSSPLLGVKLSDVYNTVFNNISKSKPEIKDKFVKNIG